MQYLRKRRGEASSLHDSRAFSAIKNNRLVEVPSEESVQLHEKETNPERTTTMHLINWLKLRCLGCFIDCMWISLQLNLNWDWFWIDLNSDRCWVGLALVLAMEFGNGQKMEYYFPEPQIGWSVATTFSLYKQLKFSSVLENIPPLLSFCCTCFLQWLLNLVVTEKLLQNLFILNFGHEISHVFVLLFVSSLLLFFCSFVFDFFVWIFLYFLIYSYVSGFCWE